MPANFLAVITILCGVGLYASLFMLRKADLARRGRLTEASVVESPRARLFGGLPNAAVGMLYYPALAVAAWRAPLPAAAAVAVLVAVLLAAVTSLFLAWSLLFVTRRSCPYCWTAHLVNWLLALIALGFWHVLFSRPEFGKIGLLQALMYGGALFTAFVGGGVAGS